MRRPRATFYGKLFGLTARKSEDQEYFFMQHDDEMRFGVMPMDEQWGDLPPHWMGYFAVDNTDAALERVLAAGGSIGVPAFDTPYGRMAVIVDPYGAAVSIVQLPAQQRSMQSPCGTWPNAVVYGSGSRKGAKTAKKGRLSLAFLASLRENCELLLLCRLRVSRSVRPYWCPSSSHFSMAPRFHNKSTLTC